MTTFAPLAAQRQPFGSVDSSRLQNLQNTKNRQNALASPKPTTGKRAHSSPTAFEDEDGENVDPTLLGSPLKKRTKAAFDGSSLKSAFTPPKNLNFVLTNAPPSPVAIASPFSPSRPTKVPVSRLNKSRPSSITSVSKPLLSTPTSTPIGRSTFQRAKRTGSSGVLSRARRSSPFTRIDPPMKHQSSPSSSLSIEAALSGTIPGYNASPTPKVQAPPQPIQTLDEQPMPNNWFFDIHEDTEQDTLTNLMEFSTTTLDISDDDTDSKLAAKRDRGKENVPPPSDLELPSLSPAAARVPAPAPAAGPLATINTTPKTRATREKQLSAADRAPLADLAPEDFYAAGLTSASVEVESPVAVAEKLVSAPPASSKLQLCMTAPPSSSSSSPVLALEGAEAEREGECDAASVALPEAGEGEIEIWESGSARDENEALAEAEAV